MTEYVSPELLIRSPALLHSYESRLRALASPVVQDPLVWQEWRRQTRALLKICAASVGGDATPATPEPPGPAVREVGLAAATLAWAELFQTVADHLAEAAGAAPDRERLARRVLPTLNRAILARVGSFADEVETPERIRKAIARDVHDWVGSSVSLALRRLDLYELRRDTRRDATTCAGCARL